MNRQHAPEVLELLLEENPNFAEDFVKRPPNSSGLAIILSRFHHDNILLIGDAAHAMVCLQDLRHIYSCQTVFCQFLRDRKQVLGTFRKGCAIGYREGSNKGNYYTLVIALVRGSSEFLELNCWTKQQHLYFCVPKSGIRLIEFFFYTFVQFPTYGTGCNAALEDCLIFDKLLDDFLSSGTILSSIF
jgi:hypothetical protein